MFGKNGGKNLRDQAQGLADTLAPHVESAKEQLAPRLEELRDQLGPRLEEAREQLRPHLEQARDELSPRIEQAREQLAPMLAEAREKAAPAVAEARERFVNDVVPTVKAALEEAREQATPYAEEAARRGRAAAAALAGEEPAPRKGGKSKWLLLGGLVAAGAVVWKRLMGDQGGSAWQSSYTPPPAPTPTSPAGAGGHVSDVAVDSPSQVNDEAGATPGEAVADAAEAGPGTVTTPDTPVDVIEAPGPDEADKA